MNNIVFAGAAKIGFTKVGYPLVTLKVSKDQLEIDAPFYGNVVFLPKDIVSIELIPALFRKSIKITHIHKDMPSILIYWSLEESSESIVRKIKEIGLMEQIEHAATDDNRKARERAFHENRSFKKRGRISKIILLLIFGTWFVASLSIILYKWLFPS
jgi:hypothetical protein